MPDNTRPFHLEYGESYAKIGEEPVIYAPSAECVRILNVTRIGDEQHFSYVVVWGADERSHTEDGDGNE